MFDDYTNLGLSILHLENEKKRSCKNKGIYFCTWKFDKILLNLFVFFVIYLRFYTQLPGKQYLTKLILHQMEKLRKVSQQ